METKEVYKAIAKVSGLVAKDGISKTRKNAQQGYSFRGIDDVYNALAPFLSDVGLCILPRVLSRVLVERETAKGNAIFYVTVQMDFDFVAANDGSMHTISTYGEAMDSADKATNKAMSAAYKYACMQAFCIPTEGDNDADQVTHDEVKAKTKPFDSPHKPVDGAFESLSEIDQSAIRGLAIEIIAHVASGDAEKAAQLIDEENLDADKKIALWSQLDSKVRSALKKAAESRKAAEAKI